MMQRFWLLLTLFCCFSAKSMWRSDIQAWIYPGQPACNAAAEFSDGRLIHVLKPEYYTVDNAGTLVRLDDTIYGCNGYSAANAALVKQYSLAQYVTVSSGQSGMSALVSTAQKRNQAVTTLVNFIKSIGFTGVELDFEEFSSWSATDYSNYKLFVTALANALHTNGGKIIVIGPPISNATEQSYYPWRYEDFNNLPVDYIVSMVYDYQYDYGAGSPIAPNSWAVNCARYVKSKVIDVNKIVIGIPSYGYHGTTGQYSIKLDTYQQTKKYIGFSAAMRDPNSFEMNWQYNGTSYFFQDSESLNSKRTLLENEGILHFTVWHLGGNNWFTGKTEPTCIK